MKKLLKFLSAIGLVGLLAVVYICFGVFEKHIETGDKQSVLFFIKSSDGFEDVVSNLDSLGIASESEFGWLAELRHLSGKNIYPGRYTLKSTMTYSDLVIYLRSGQIDEITITFNNVRTLDQLAKKVSRQIEASENSILNELQESEKYGYDKSTFLAVFIPNTYKMYWNTSGEQFVKRMVAEHKRFWNQSRLAKAKKMNLTPVEVSTLASIVQSEQNLHQDEWPIIAGLYFNRLQKGIKLQSDPTVVYAWGDFTLKRIYYKHLKIDSKYNTYKYTGLPPGPIRVPASGVLDAVLGYQKHKYIFMCANPEFSGKHAFAVTNSEHEKNARKYRAFLKKNNIH
jgi:UPF0755 protein